LSRSDSFIPQSERIPLEKVVRLEVIGLFKTLSASYHGIATRNKLFPPQYAHIFGSPVDEKHEYAELPPWSGTKILVSSLSIFA